MGWLDFLGIDKMMGINKNLDCAKFAGFVPSEEYKDFLVQQLKRVFELAPSDSVLTMYLEFKDDYYECVLFISSQYNNFDTHAINADPYKVVMTAKKTIFKMLRRWKKSRFQMAEDLALQPVEVNRFDYLHRGSFFLSSIYKYM